MAEREACFVGFYGIFLAKIGKRVIVRHIAAHFMTTKHSFCVVSASALAVGMAQGSVIYSGPLNLQQGSSGTLRQAVDMDGDLTPDFTFGYEGEGSAQKPYQSYIDARTFVSTEIPSQSGAVSLLAKSGQGLPLTGAGTTIGLEYANTYPGNTTDQRAYFFNKPDDEPAGDWSGTELNDGYVGIIFKPDGETHYGWLRFINDPSVDPKTLTLAGWAYETTPGLAIETAVVPEPTTSALAGLGLAALLALRRRAQQAR